MSDVKEIEMATPEPQKLVISSSLRRAETTDGTWISVRGVDRSQPRVLLQLPVDGRYDEFWLSLGETATAGGETWRFENIEFGQTASQWEITVSQVLAGSPPYEPPAAPDSQVWQPAVLRPNGTLDERALLALEQRIGGPLPRLYRQWLADNNGASPAQDVWIKGWNFCLNEIHPLLGIRPDVPHLDLSFGESRRSPWLTDDYLVVAVPLGGLLAVKLRDVYADQIVFLSDAACHAANAYDRSQYTSPADYLSRTALFAVAGSIHEFCQNLQPAPPVTPARIDTPGQPSTW
ncbi:DUF6406 domain-containing protein [Actinoplanes sp. GCM10030250]|uniref:DUF6406 domain-containing protein n=1 Tax=Actinoplanes sp. GCM10030250 TaxID=3273376 RepID=UPI00361C3FF7